MNRTASVLGFAFALACCVWVIVRSLPVVPATAAPAAWSWQAGPDLNFPHMGHTATLLPDGRVVIIGGLSDWANGVRLGYAEIFDPATNSWTVAAGQSGKPRYQHTATLLEDGRILVVGGSEAFGGVVDSAEIFDPATGLFTPVASPGAMKQHAAVALAGGDVLVFGGQGTVTSAWRYNLAGNQWSFAGNGPGGFDVKAVRLDNGKVVAGGQLYDPAANAWSAIANPPDGWYPGSAGGAGVAVNGAAGFSGFGIRVTYFSNNTWSSSTPQLISRSYHAATVADGAVMQVGGWDEDFNFALTAEVAGQAAGSIQTGRVWHTATTLKDGRVLVVGGQTSGNVVLKSVEIGVPPGFATPTPTATPTTTPTITPTATNSPTPTVTPTATNTPTPTVTPTATNTPTITPTPRTDGVIAGRVWKDENVWAVQDGEPGLPGIPVLLYTNQGGGLVAQTVTDASGHYTFTNLAAATGIVYQLAVTGPAGHGFVEANVGSDDTLDSDIESSQPAGQDLEGPWIGLVDVPLDGSNLVQSHWDAGIHSNRVTGRIWWDRNEDGIQNGTEPGWIGVDVGIIRGDPAFGGPIVRTVTTDANGVFTTTNLAPDRYYATTTFANPYKYRISPVNRGNDGSLDSDAVPSDCYPQPGCPLRTPPLIVPTNGSPPPQGFGILGTYYLYLEARKVEFVNGHRYGDSFAFPLPVPASLEMGLTSSGGPAQTVPLGDVSVQPGSNTVSDLVHGRYTFTWPKLNDYLLLPPTGLYDGEPDPATGISRKWVPVVQGAHQTYRISALYYKPNASGSATPNGGGSVSTGRSRQRTAALTRGVSLSVPPGAVTQTVTLHLTDLAASATLSETGAAPGYLPIDYGFLWEVAVDDLVQGAFPLTAAATVTLTVPADAQPDNLNQSVLMQWDSAIGAWVAPDRSCGAATGWQSDPATGLLSAHICRSGRYGVFLPASGTLYLPTVQR